MTLVAADALDPKRFFGEACEPLRQGSSFDLTVGGIYDSEGRKIAGPFRLKPGHMVQVASAQVFALTNQITGHVTYKTTLTRKGIWALAVGIIDPGWDGPISTTLLNFSRIDHVISEGDPFLRVSFFEHAPGGCSPSRSKSYDSHAQASTELGRIHSNSLRFDSDTCLLSESCIHVDAK